MYRIFADDKKLRYEANSVLELIQEMSEDINSQREDDMGKLCYHGTDIDVLDADDWKEYQMLHEYDDPRDVEEYKQAILKESGIPETIGSGEKVIHIWGRSDALDQYELCVTDLLPDVMTRKLNLANESVPTYRIEKF